MKACISLKRAVSLLLTLCLVLAAVPISVPAVQECVCTEKCSFSAPNGACAHCSCASREDFQCMGSGILPRSAPEIGTVSYSGPQLLDSTVPGSVSLSRQNTSVPGVLQLMADRLIAGSHDYTWKFTPDDIAYESVVGTITLSAAHDWDPGSCTQAPFCKGCGETDGSAPGHNLHYSVSGFVITESCSTQGFEHSGRLTLELPAGASVEYTGAPVEPLRLTYSESWTGPRDLTIAYSNNVQIGTGEGSVTVGGVTLRRSFEITPVSMDVTAADKTVTYNASQHSISVTVPQGADLKYGTKSGVYDLTSAPSYKDAGVYTVYYRVTKENYKTVEGSVRLTIAPLPLTIAAENARKTYGEKDPETFGWKITAGKVLEGEQITGITVTRVSGEDVGNYAITPTDGGKNKNYAITFVPGIFDIAHREITVTWQNLVLDYNGTEQAPKAIAGNTAFGDQLELTVSGGRKDATKGQKVTATVTGITGPKGDNYRLPDQVSAQYEIKKAHLVLPEFRHTNETLDGKHDGIIRDVTPDMEYRREEDEEYTPITDTELKDLAPGKYLIRYAESDNCFVSREEEVIIGPGEKLKIILPKEQPGYTLTVDKGEVSYGGSAVLTLQLAEGCQRTEDFALKINGRAVDLPEDGKYELKDIKEDQTVTVEGISDGELPEVKIKIGNRIWDSFQTGIRFNIYYNSAQTVTVTAEDAGSGIDEVHYHLAVRELTEDQLEKVYDWKKYTGAFTIRPDNKYVIYVRAKDKAGNVTYISSEGLIFDELPPSIDGVRNRSIYYTTQQAEASDNFRLNTFKLNGSTFEGEISGNPEVETKYTLNAADVAGNTTTITITMMPISSLGEGLPSKEEMTLEDLETINGVLEKVHTILEKECKHATDGEKKALKDLEQHCADLLKALEPVAAAAEVLDALPDALTVQPDERRYIDVLDEAQEVWDALTEREQQMLGNRMDRLTALRKAMTSYKIVDGNQGRWSHGDARGITFVANGYYASLDSYTKGAYGKFLGVEVDGVMLDGEHYTVRGGSTVVTLKAEWLEGQDSGKHTIRLHYTDGQTEEGSFRISHPIGASSADRGLNLVGILFWVALGLACLVSIALIVLLIIWKKEKR